MNSRETKQIKLAIEYCQYSSEIISGPVERATEIQLLLHQKAESGDLSHPSGLLRCSGRKIVFYHFRSAKHRTGEYVFVQML